MAVPALAASDVGNAIGALVGTSIGAAVLLAVAFRSFRLRDEASPSYVGLSRWMGENVRTRGRAMAFVVVVAIAVFVVNLLLSG